MPPEKCMKCDKSATHKITKIVKGQVHDILLCDEHAQVFSPYLHGKKPDQSKLLELLQHFLKQQEHNMTDSGQEDNKEEGPECSNCGLTYSAYRKTLLLGCSDCYDSFGKLLLNDLRKMHGAVSQQDAPPMPSAPLPQTGEEAAFLPSFQKESKSIVTEADPASKNIAAKEKALGDLEKRLQEAIKEEDFKLAANLRDAIRKRKERGDETSPDQPDFPAE